MNDSLEKLMNEIFDENIHRVRECIIETILNDIILVVLHEVNYEGDPDPIVNKLTKRLRELNDN